MPRKKTPPAICGAYELAGLLGVSQQRVQQLRREDPAFPVPFVVLRMGPVWLEDDVRAYAAVERKPGRPSK